MQKEGKLIIIFSLVLLAFLILFGFTEFYEGHPIKQYAVVITASSSGTKLVLFEWHRFNKSTNGMPIDIQEVRILTQTTMTYYTLMEASESAVEGFIDGLVVTAKKEIPLGLKFISSIFFNIMMDNGVDPSKFVKLENTIKTRLQRSPFYFKPSHLNLFDGKQKAAYHWMAVNYLLRQSDEDNYNLERTAGVNHIANDSMVISYAITDAEKNKLNNQQDILYVSLFNKNYTVFAKTFDQLGFTTSFNKMLNNITSSTKYTGCLPTGYSKVENGYTVIGMSDFNTCQRQVHALLNISDACYQSPNCSIDGQYMPLPLSNIFWSTNQEMIDFMGLNGNTPIKNEYDGPLTNYTTFVANATRLCGFTNSQYNNFYHTNVTNTCFNATLMLTTYNYAFRLSDSNSFVWASNIDNYPLTWEVGFFLQDGSYYYPWGNFVLMNVGDGARITFLVISTIASVGSACILIFMTVRLLKKKKEYTNYQNITVL